MAKASEESVAAYMRIPRSTHDTLLGAANLLELPLAKVINALFNFTLAPHTFRTDWTERVRELRSAIEENVSANRRPDVCLYDFSARQWEAEKAATYAWLERMGLVEDFMWRHRPNERVLCSFKVTDTGRIIAEVFNNCWLSEAPDDVDLEEGADMAG